MYIYNSLSVHCTVPPNFCVCGAHLLTPTRGHSNAVGFIVSYVIYICVPVVEIVIVDF